MSDDLLTQLAEYGRYHRSEQEVAEMTAPVEAPSITVVELHPLPDRRESPMSKKLILSGLLAVAAAIAVIAGVVVATNDDDTSPTADDNAAVTFGEQSTLATADAFFDAYNTGDDVGVLSLFGPEIAISDNFVGNWVLQEWEQLLVWNGAQGTVFSTPECRTTNASTHSLVTIECVTENRNALVQAVAAPGVPTTVKMTISPTGIETLRFVYGSPDFEFVVIPFDQWMGRENPDDLASVGFGAWNSLEGAIENGVLTAEFALEWAAYLEANNCGYRDGC